MSENQYCNCHPNELDNLPSPLFRLVCHCKTCQAFFSSKFNDECTFLMKDCQGVNLDNVEFKGYQKGFSPMKRGVCKICNKLSHQKIKFGPLPEYLLVSSSRVKNQVLPAPFAHVYYDRRCEDMDDGVTKLSGHLMSQLAIQWAIMKGLIRIFYKKISK